MPREYVPPEKPENDNMAPSSALGPRKIMPLPGVYQEGIPSRFVDADLTGCTIDDRQAEGEPIDFSGLFD